MLAAVTRGESSMELVDVPVPGEPGPGEVVLRPEVVGVCGSDVHLFDGDLGDDVFPRIQGHEISAVVDAVGPGAEHRPLKRHAGSKTKARFRGLRSSEDRAGLGRGRSLEGLSL